MSRVWKFIFSFSLFLAVCYFGLMWFVNHEVGKEINRAVADTPGMALLYADLSVSLRDHTVTLKGVETKLPQGQHFTAEAVRISRFDQLNPVPHFATIEAKGVVVDATFANFGSWVTPLIALETEAVSVDFGLDYEYAPKTKTLTVKELVIKATDLCDINFSGAVDQLDLNALSMEKLIGLRMKEATLTFTDHALVDGMVHSAAQGLGISDLAARKQVAAELAAMARFAGDSDNPVAENALLGFERFVHTPGTITISARPAQPVPYLYFFMGRDVYDNLRLMNVSVETGPSDNI